jgi:hypothetical protein
VRTEYESNAYTITQWSRGERVTSLNGMGIEHERNWTHTHTQLQTYKLKGGKEYAG